MTYEIISKICAATKFIQISDSHRVTMRGCAKQDFSYQVYNEAERGWDTVTEIKDSIYPEGCFFSAGQTHGLRREPGEQFRFSHQLGSH